MRSVTKVFSLLLATVAVAVVGGEVNETAEFVVGGHHFEVPKDHLFEMVIPWLPKPESDAFIFLFEPNADPNHIPEHEVLVERLSRFCPTDSATEATQMLRIVCGQEASSVPETPPFINLPNELGSWSSDLYAVDKSPGGDGVINRRQVAYCQYFEPNPAKPNASTVCTTFWAYKGMRLQFSFDEKESANMPMMKAKAMALLDHWEVR